MTQTVLLLGAYGLIGAEIYRALRKAEVSLRGAGRSERAARQLDPEGDWLIADLAQMTEAEWQRALEGVDVVINAAGALQDGAHDTLSEIHDGMVTRIIAAAPEGLKVVQISAAGVSPEASTAFFRTKAAGDARLAASGLDWVILRPTLVIAPAAYGGTALLRAAAAMPIGLSLFPEARMETVSASDLAQAVLATLRGEVPSRRTYDLTAGEDQSFDDTLSAFRKWLGAEPWRWRIPLPRFLLTTSGRVGDVLGWLGWRPPLRSTALQTLAEGVSGDPVPWQAAGGPPLRPLSETLREMPATVQEKWFARSFLLFPVIIGTLALFWLLSGVIGLLNLSAATDVLTSRGFATRTATLCVVTGALADIALACGLLSRPTTRAAALGTIGLTLGYLGAATLFAPDLWADPLGPLVKTLPALTLSSLALALMPNR